MEHLKPAFGLNNLELIVQEAMVSAILQHHEQNKGYYTRDRSRSAKALRGIFLTKLRHYKAWPEIKALPPVYRNFNWYSPPPEFRSAVGLGDAYLFAGKQSSLIDELKLYGVACNCSVPLVAYQPDPDDYPKSNLKPLASKYLSEYQDPPSIPGINAALRSMQEVNSALGKMGSELKHFLAQAKDSSVDYTEFQEI